MKLAQLQEARYATRQKLKLSDFTPGDHIIITSRSLRGTERRFGKVRIVNYNNLHGITYAPAYRDDMLPTGQGHLKPSDIGKGPYGIQHVEIIKRERPVFESSYAGDHPVVDWINNFMKRQRHVGATASRGLESNEQEHQANTILTQNYGNPVAMTSKSIEWNVRYEDGLYHIELLTSASKPFAPGEVESGIVITKAI